MTQTTLSECYRDYIACLNRQDWPDLHKFAQHDVRHDGRPFGLAGYRAMLERDFAKVPDLRFNIELLVCEPPTSRAGSDSTAGPRSVPRPAGERQAGPVRRERLLPIPERKDRGGLVGDRQGRDRGPALRRSDAPSVGPSPPPEQPRDVGNLELP